MLNQIARLTSSANSDCGYFEKPKQQNIKATKEAAKKPPKNLNHI